MKDVKCYLCKKIFKRKISQIKLAKRHFCSINCQNLSRRKGKIISCSVCSRRVYKKNKDLIKLANKYSFCSIKCSNILMNSLRKREKHPNWINGKTVYRNILSNSKVERVCRLCKEQDKRILMAHHIDHNRDNNKINNLSWLCYNCHFLVHHYSSEYERLNNIVGYGN